MYKQSLNIVYAVIIGLTVLTGTSLHAQQLSEIDEIRVIAPYQPSISEAFKINQNPAMDDTIRVEMRFTYQLQPLKIINPYLPGPFTPTRMRQEQAPDLPILLVKAGYGAYQSPYVEGFFNTRQSGNHALGLHVRHLSSHADVKDHPNSTFSQSRANIYGSRFFRNTTLDADIAFERQGMNFYALIPDSFPVTAADDIRQQYDLLSSAIGFGSGPGAGHYSGYHLGIKHQWLNDRFNNTEHIFSLAANIDREIGADPFGLADRQRLRVDLMADYAHHSTVLGDFSTGIYRIRPQLSSSINMLHFHLGGELAIEDMDADYDMHIYPRAGFSLDIVPNGLVAYMEVSGGLEHQTWQNLSSQNPFVRPAPATAFTSTRSAFGGGLKGCISDMFSFNVQLTNSKIDNYTLFGISYDNTPANPLSPAGPHNRHAFMVLYDDIRKLHVQGEIFARWGDHFSLRAQGDYFNYTMDQQEKPWHKPELLLSLQLRYSFRDKIILTSDLIGRGASYGVILADQHTNLPITRSQKVHDFYLDANAGLEYRYTKNLSAFLNLYNMQNETYARWTNYPGQGFGFLAGLSFGF